MANPRGEMPFLDHLEELCRRLLWSLLAIVFCSALGFFVVMRLHVIDALLAPLHAALDAAATEDPSFTSVLVGGRLQFHNLTEPLFFVLKLSLLTGLLLASPVVVYQAWAFLAPALEDRERRLIVPTFSFGLLLFAAGASLGYFIALPLTIGFLLEFGSEWFTPALTAGYYLPLVLRLLVAFGLVFELPVVVTVLSSLGIVTPRFLRAKRRHAIVLITVLAAFLSPGDMLSITVLLMAPLIALYEISILLSVTVTRRRQDSFAESVPVLVVLGMVTARWRNRFHKTVAAEGV